MNTTTDSRNNQKIGLSMTFAAGLLLTVDAPLLRLAHTDVWTLIAVRGFFTFSAMWAFWVMFKRRKGGATPFVNGYLSVFLSCMTALVSIMFINAIHLTSVANVVFILAFNPMFAALLSWIFLRERLGLPTLLAIVVSFLGVVIIVWDSIDAGNALGDFLALGMSLLLAVSLTLIRKSGTDQSMSPAFGSLMAAATVMMFANPYTLPVVSWGWLALNGLVVIPAASALMMLGPKYIAAPIVAMFFLLETVLTPVWMWLIFGEIPSNASLIGGAIITATLLVHSVWLLSLSDRNGRAKTDHMERQAR